jgi:hypothetical protein
MKKYKALLQGENLLMEIDEKPTKCGFFATRYVEATDPDDAEAILVEFLQNEKEFINTALNDKTDQPLVFLNRIVELESFEGIPVPGTGYSFFPESSEE